MKFYLPLMSGPYQAPKVVGDWVQEGELFADRITLGNEIATGELYAPPKMILEIDTDRGTAKDITREIALAVGERSNLEQSPPFDELRDWLDAHGAKYFRDDETHDDFDPRREWGTLCHAMQGTGR
jgi:hypothetical protein